jgi:glycosyltransferase involved in cell wall biosynthesis
LGVRSRIRFPEFDVIHTHDVYTNVFFGLWGRLGSPRCGIIASRRWWREVPRRSLASANALAYRAADRVLANSPGVGNLLIAEGVPARKVAYVPNFLDAWAFRAWTESERMDWRDRHGIPRHAYVVGIVARLSPVKDHSLLFSAVARLPADSWLAVVGDGPLRRQLESEASSRGLSSRVRFLGAALGQTNLHAPFDVSVLCSKDEGFPNAIVEAFAAARPVVATSVGGVPDIVEDGANGLLVPSGDAEALSNSLMRLRSDRALRERYGENGHRRVAEHHSAHVAMAALAGLYRRVSAERRSRFGAATTQ